MGHSEPASGLCGLTKVIKTNTTHISIISKYKIVCFQILNTIKCHLQLCLAYHKGQIPANLHFQEPVGSAKDGKVKVVTEHLKFDRGYTALNSFSLTGANYHVVLKGHYKKKV